jgi:hypothetical protein
MNFRPPRPLEVQNDVIRKDEQNFEYVKFDLTSEGVIKSHIFHHRDSFGEVYPIWNEYRKYFKH